MPEALNTTDTHLSNENAINFRNRLGEPGREQNPLGDARFMGTEQRKRMGAESSHMGMAESKPSADPLCSTCGEGLMKDWGGYGHLPGSRQRHVVRPESPEMTAVLGPPVDKRRKS